MRIRDRIGNLVSKLYENTGKIGAGLAYTGAIGTATAGTYFALRGGEAIAKYVPKEVSVPIIHEIAYGLSWPIAAIGLGHGISAVKELITLGKRANILDYTGALLRTVPIMSPLLYKISDGDLVYTVAIPLLVTATGHGLRYVSRLLKNRTSKRESEEWI